jgi:hypothetical protein
MQLKPEDATKYLQYLSIGHYILGALIALFGCLPILHLIVGIGLTTAGFASQDSHAAPLEFIGPFFIVIAGAIIAMFWTVATLVILTGRFLSQRKNHLFCIVVGFVEAVFFTPIGTVLGVLTIIVLIDDATKATFQGAAEATPAQAPDVSP